MKMTKKSLAPLFAVALLATAGCATEAPEPADSLAGEVNVYSVTALTGAAAFAGLLQVEGIELAIDEINESGILGEAEIVYTKKDTASDPKQAASLATQAAANPSVGVILGSPSSAESVAVAPLVEAAQIPTIFTRSSSAGVVIGDYTYRATPPVETFYNRVFDRFVEEGYKTISIVYSNSYPTNEELVNNYIPDFAEEAGMEILSISTVQTSTVDYTAAMSNVVNDDPDVAIILVPGAQGPQAMTQLRQSGYDGPVAAGNGNGGGSLAPAGEDAAGVFWPDSFFYTQPGEISEAFAAAYEERYGKVASAFAAEGYDAAWMIAHAVVASGGTDRASIQKGLQQVVKDGFEGALGAVKFDGNDMRLKGVLVEWTGSEEALVK